MDLNSKGKSRTFGYQEVFNGSEWYRMNLNCLMFKLLATVFEVSNNMPLLCLTPHLILIRYKAFQSNRSTRVNLPCTNTNFRTEPIPKTISKPCASIYKNTSRIYALAKSSSVLIVFSND